MLIDASYESAMQIRELLGKVGLKLDEWATSGVGWAEAWQRGRPAIVIIDLQLPRRDGLYCLAKIRELNPEANVLFMHSYCGLTANDIEYKALAHGATAVVQKPIVPSRFLLTIERMMK